MIIYYKKSFFCDIETSYYLNCLEDCEPSLKSKNTYKIAYKNCFTECEKITILKVHEIPELNTILQTCPILLNEVKEDFFKSFESETK